MLLWTNLTLWHMSIVCSPLSSRLITSNFSYILSFADFSLGLHYVMYIMFLSHFGHKSQRCWKEHCISHVIISLTSSIHTYDCWCYSVITFCYPATQDSCSQRPLMPNHINLNYHVNSKSGINFVVASKHNCAKETLIKRDMPVILIQYSLLWTTSSVVLFMPLKLVFTVSYYILPVP